MTKLKAKNWKLSEERRRRAAEAAKAEKKQAQKKQGQVGSQTDVGKEKAEAQAVAAAENGDIHPSRRSRVTTR